MDDLLADFLTETGESLADLDVALVKLEQTPDDAATLQLIFRLVHTIKGTCGFLGLPRLERVAHAAENVLGRVRDKVLPVTPELVTCVLSAIDRIKLIIAGIASTEKEPQGDDAALIAALDAASEGKPAATPPATAPEPKAREPEPPVAEEAVPAAQEPPAPQESLALPAAQAQPAAPPPQAQPVEAVTAESSAGNQSIRVGVDVLEELMTLVSELVLTRNQLLQLARSQEGSGESKSAFTVPLQRLSHITTDLQEGVMKTRMQPIGNAWNKLPRLVRDLARDLGKKIELVMGGAETELDRQVLELIRDPLTHLVRNSADHGLETPAERRAAGKPEVGRITLNAFHEGGHIIIEIGDDGRGLSVARIRAKALASGLATEADLANMTEAQIQRFILRAGFSTAATVTAVSGRGVGMDVVKTNVTRIGGTIELRSIEGQGTIFTVKIPLTLAIVSALIVEAGGERFAIPQISVVELVRASYKSGGESASVIEHIEGTPVLRLRDRLLPLVNLQDLLQLSSRTAVEAGEVVGDTHCIVVTQVGATRLGIIVDRIFDTEEIVVKPVAPVLRGISMFSGNTILGDGSVIMILDTNGIARATGTAGGEARAAVKTEAERLALSGGTADRTAMLLFRAGAAEPKAVPLGLVARLEEIPRERIEFSAGQPVTQYRGHLMPLVPMSGSLDTERPHQSVLVFADTDQQLGRDRCVGLVVDEIVDVVEDRLRIELGGERPGLLGTAVIAGHATDVVDITYWLNQAFGNWFRGDHDGDARSARVLVVEDSDFFRQLIVPTLSAAGYEVTAAADALHALRMREAGLTFDAIVSDIEMPELNGNEFVRRLRAEGPWSELPVIALTASGSAAAIEAARTAGFTEHVQKFEREALLASLRRCLAARTDMRLAA